MRGFNLILGVLVFVFLVGISNAVDVSDCTNITNQGTYTLTNSITGNHTVQGACIFINTSNVTLNGAGYSLTGNWSGGMNTVGIYLNNSYVQNVTITGFTISNYTIGIAINFTNTSITIQNCNIFNNSYGISMRYNNYTTITATNISNNTIGLYAFGGTGNKFSNLRVYNNKPSVSDAAVVFTSTGTPPILNTVLNDSYIYNNSNDGILVNGANVTNISNNQIYGNGRQGVSVTSVQDTINTTIMANTFYNNSGYSIFLYSHTGVTGNNTIMNNYIYTNYSASTGKYFGASPGSSQQYHFNLTNLYIYSSFNGGQSYIKFSSAHYNASTGSIVLNSSNLALGTNFASANSSDSLGPFNSTSTIIQLYFGTIGTPIAYYNLTNFFTSAEAISAAQYGSLYPTIINEVYAYFTVTSFSGYVMSYVPPTAPPSSDDSPAEETTKDYSITSEVDCLNNKITLHFFNEDGEPVMIDQAKYLDYPSGVTPYVTLTFSDWAVFEFTSNGDYTFSIDKEDSYSASETVEVDCPAYQSNSVYFYSLSGPNDAVYAENLNCEEPFTFTVKIVDETVNPVSGVELMISKSSESGEGGEPYVDYATTNSNGIAIFTLPGHGAYTVSLSDDAKELYTQMHTNFQFSTRVYCEEETCTEQKEASVSHHIFDCSTGQLSVWLEFKNVKGEQVTIQLVDSEGNIVEEKIFTSSNSEIFYATISEPGTYTVKLAENDCYSMEDYIIRDLTLCPSAEKEMLTGYEYSCRSNLLYISVQDKETMGPLDTVLDGSFAITCFDENDVCDYDVVDTEDYMVFTSGPLQEGYHKFIITSNGYATSEFEFEVECLEFETFSITCPECIEEEKLEEGEEAGVGGVPEGATVNVYGPDGKPVTVTQKDGKYSFTPLAGNITIEVTKDGSVISGQVIEVLPKSLDKDNAIKKFFDSTEGKILLLALILILLVYWYQKRRAKQRAAKFKGIKR